MGHRCHAVQVRCVDYQLVILFCLAAVWRKRMTSHNLADSGRKNGRKYMNLADHVRRFVRKWLEGRRDRGRDGGIVLGRGAACAFPLRMRRGGAKALIHSGRPEGRPPVFGSVPLREQALDGAVTKNS